MNQRAFCVAGVISVMLYKGEKISMGLLWRDPATNPVCVRVRLVPTFHETGLIWLGCGSCCATTQDCVQETNTLKCFLLPAFF